MSQQSSLFSRKTMVIVGGLAIVLGLVTAASTGFFATQTSQVKHTFSNVAVEESYAPELALDSYAQPLGAPSPLIATSKIAPYPPFYGNDALDQDQRYYTSSASYSFVVKDVSEYLRNTREYILNIDGRVLSSDQNKSNKTQSGSLYVKVPAAQFDAVVNRVGENVSEVVFESVTVSDQTGVIVSSQEQVARLEEQKIQKEIELLEAVSEAQKKRIELQISQLERQIAQAQDTQESAQNTVEYATIHISVANKARYFDPSIELDFWGELEQALGSVKAIGLMLAYAAIWIGVYALVLVPIVTVVRFVWLRTRRATSSSDSQVDA